ncbi:enoyl-CoA hydratase/isomerase family protein [Tomitella biformata]|uniref:enoyl-CoA hydratase/isomerase family protein n=1 Tax=Tomitella biformata TaxID=630403 RepID=UPI000463C605|nr:enoyl-CoA hydratase/isomerase family protein [Tomitella biformata]
MSEAADAPEVLVERRGRIGVLTLNRPRAINALTHAMVRVIDDALIEWAADPAVEAVVLTGAGERGLCAGGDIVSIHRDGQRIQEGLSGDSTLEFWREEYILNARIGSYPKPYIAVMDGIVLGGGVGISAHANTRIVTETSSIGMPEVGIGFIPDVGGTYLLARAPGNAGIHAALTTQRFGPGAAIANGFADHYVLQEKLPELLESLASEGVQALARFAGPAPAETSAPWVAESFAADTVEEILARLDGVDGADAAKAASQIRGKSPVALKVTLRSIREAAELPSLEAVLDLEYRVSTAALSSHDLVEGIRAQIIDKDRNPQWQPATLEDVTSADVDAYFALLGDNELGLSDQALTERAGNS